jgi:uncharacterized membrane protein YhhN
MNRITAGAYIVLLIVSAFHLYGTYKGNRELRVLTKGLLMPLIIIAYCCGTEPDLYIIAAMFFSWAGDVLLMLKHPGALSMGGIAFLFSHICFISAFGRHVDFNAVPFFIVIPLFLVYLTSIFLHLRGLWPSIPVPLKVPMTGYLIANATMNMFSCMMLFSHPGAPTITVFIGAVLFFISDMLLFDVRFHRSSGTYKKHTLEMLTYILGETLISYGLIMMV